MSKIETWQERYPTITICSEIERAMQAEIDELRAALEQSRNKSSDLKALIRQLRDVLGKSDSGAI